MPEAERLGILDIGLCPLESPSYTFKGYWTSVENSYMSAVLEKCTAEGLRRRNITNVTCADPEILRNVSNGMELSVLHYQYFFNDSMWEDPIQKNLYERYTLGNFEQQHTQNYHLE